MMIMMIISTITNKSKALMFVHRPLEVIAPLAKTVKYCNTHIRVMSVCLSVCLSVSLYVNLLFFCTVQRAMLPEINLNE